LRRLILTWIFFALLGARALAAQEIIISAPGKTIHIPKIQAKVHIDGKLDEPVWSQLTPITAFTQTNPDLGAPVSEKTEAFVFYDDEKIYFGFRCFDSQPEKMVHRYGAHDAFTNSDSVNVLIDTFHDRRTGYFFSLNSRNSQFDATARESGQSGDFGSYYDATWDGIWESGTSVESWGWSAEIAIPFKSIRISHAAQQIWGLNLGRDIVRKNENSWWYPVSRYDGTARPSKAGDLTGLENVKVGRNLELIPFVTTSYRQARWMPQHAGATGNGGLDARYGITQNLTLSFTANPDFADTEADEFTSQVSRYEIFFPEKRKFFTEGSNYFVTPLGLFFSRRVGSVLSDGEPQRILEGAKLTGKSGPWTVGALEAVTQRTDFIDPSSGLHQIAPAALFGVVRVQHDILEKSAVGFMSTTRLQNGVLHDSDGNVVSQSESTNGLDLSIVSGDHITWISQTVANQNTTHPGFSVEHLGGISTFRYDSETWTTQAAGKFLGRNFDIRSTGFEPEVDRMSGQASILYKPFINRYGMRQIFAQINYDENNGTRGELEDAGADADLRIQFKNFWNFETRYSYDRTRFFLFGPATAISFPAFTRQLCPDDLACTRVYVTPTWQFTLSTNSSRSYSASVGYITSGLVQFDENFFGYQKRVDVSVNARIGEHHRVELTAVDARESLRDHVYFQDRRFLISRWTYQVTPKLRGRVLAQYAEDINGHNLSVNSLLAYDFTARSAAFLGYNRQRHSPLDLADLGNVVFVKLSYLFSF
jgi:Domain of unknown function (DUF5916)/Carbohydrate family 9 binding domain-like